MVTYSTDPFPFYIDLRCSRAEDALDAGRCQKVQTKRKDRSEDGDDAQPERHGIGEVQHDDAGDREKTRQRRGQDADHLQHTFVTV